MRAYRKPLSIVMAILMLLGVVFQTGIGTITAKAANDKTHCLYFTDSDKKPMTNVTVEYGVAKDEQSVAWTPAINCGDGRYEYSYDFSIIENDHDYKLFVKWDTHGVEVAPVSGKRSSLTSWNDYNSLIGFYNAGKQKDFTGQHEYDFFGGYSACFVDFWTQNDNMVVQYNVTSPAKWAIIVYNVAGAATVSPSDFINGQGAFTTTPGKQTTTINGASCEYYMFYSDGTEPNFFFPQNPEKSQISVDVNSIVSDHFNGNAGGYWLAAFPMDASGMILENSGNNFTYSMNNSGPINPGPDDSSTGLKAVWGVDAENCVFWGNPWWDGPNSWQNIDCTTFYFVLKYIADDGTETKIGSTEFANISVNSQSGVNQMKLTDTGKMIDGHAIIKWQIPAVLDTYVISYMGSELTVDIKYPQVGVYNSPAQGPNSLINDISFKNDKCITILTDNISNGGDKYVIKSVYTGHGDSDNIINREDVLKGESAYVKECTPLYDALGNIYGYTLELADEWPSEYNDLSSVMLTYEYGNVNEDWTNRSWSWIERYEYNDPDMPENGLLICSSIMQMDDNTGFYIDGNPYWWSGFRNDEFNYLSDFDFIAKYVDDQHNVKALNKDDILVDKDFTMEESDYATVTYRGSVTVNEDGQEVVYPVLHFSCPKAPGWNHTLSYSDSTVTLHLDLPRFGFYYVAQAENRNIILPHKGGGYSVRLDEIDTFYALTSHNTSSDDVSLEFLVDKSKVTAWIDGRETEINPAYFFEYITALSDKNDALEINLVDEWPEVYKDFYSVRLYIYCFEDTPRYVSGNEWPITIEILNPAMQWEEPSHQLLFTNNICYDAANNKYIAVDPDCSSYWQDFRYGLEADFIFKLVDNENDTCSVVTLDDLDIPVEMSMRDTGKEVVVDGVSYPIYHMVISDERSEYYIREKETLASIDIHLLAPNVAFYMDNKISWHEMYNRVETCVFDSDEDAYLTGYMPPVATYINNWPIYVISNAYNGYEQGSFIDSLKAEYHDDENDTFVEFDINEACDISWEKREICGQKVNVMAVVNFKDEWPKSLKDKGLDSFRLSVASRHYNCDEGNLSVENEADDSEYLYVRPLFLGCEATLDDNINMNFRVALDEAIIKNSTAYLSLDYEYDCKKYYPIDFEQYCDGVDDWGFPVYSFPCELKSVYMNEKVTMYLRAEGEETAAGGISFADYANVIRKDAKSSEELVELVDALLNYGAYAQEYFEHNTDNLANNGLFDSENPVDKISSSQICEDIRNKLGDKGATVFTGTMIEENLFSFYGMSLSCLDRISYNIYFRVEDEAKYHNIDIICDADNVIVEHVRNNLYKMTITGVDIWELDNYYKFEFYDYSVSEEMIIDYITSPLSYIYRYHDNYGNMNWEEDRLSNLTKALYLYYEAAKVYKNAANY